MLNNKVHEKINKNHDKLLDWFYSKRHALPLPIYTSVDIRDSSFKIASVDANIYPAGFNNICPTDKEQTPEIFKSYIHHFYGDDIKKIGIITEEHTKNAFYWENVNWLLQIVSEAGYEVRILFPREMESDLEVEASSGKKLTVSASKKINGKIVFKDGFTPCLLISNNDFSQEHREWISGITTPINPPQELGWFQRKKSDHFIHYNRLAKEFAEVIGLDPWEFEVKTELFSGLDINNAEIRESLAGRVDQMLKHIKANYEKRGITDTPTVFVKNNSGTYGLAVLSAQSGDEVRDWNNRMRTKMKAAKGGAEVSEVIIQEGISTKVTAEGYTAEPVIYIVGCDLAGGFFRAHQEKGPTDSLNSPGAVYKRMCVADLKISPEDHLYENVYGWVARLSSLAIGREMEALKLKLPKNCEC